MTSSTKLAPYGLGLVPFINEGEGIGDMSVSVALNINVGRSDRVTFQLMKDGPALEVSKVGRHDIRHA